METKSLTIVLGVEERDALYAAAYRDCRHPRDQARYLLRRALFSEEAGRLPADTANGGASAFQGASTAVLSPSIHRP